VAAASSQVAAASQSLAEGNSNQASSLEETSSSLEELSSMTRQTADNASQAKAMMTEVRQIIAKVNHHMGDMATAIRDITKSSQETGKIIKTIDEIAFQTNLLALNAAVEAARAGEAGAGFAVVANEVRNLAMRAAEAAKNTSSLIENTIQSVHKGNTLTASTLEAFKENMTISDKVGLLIEEIATASQEQSHGIGQINTAVANMDKVTQDAAANAEESASASEEMNAQAEQMKVFVRDLVNVLNGQNNLRRAAGAGSLKKIGMTKTKPSTRADLVNAKKGALALPMDRMGKARIVRPEDIIPLEEDKFKDF
jgi:methyl-accepting chemotaxis protein